MKIPKFKNESEEADWLYAHRKQIERRLRNAKPVLDASGKPLSPAEIAAAYIAEQKPKRRRGRIKWSTIVI